MAAVAAAEVSARTGEVGAESERQARQTPGEVQALKARDNLTNWLYLARIYVVIAAAIARRRVGRPGRHVGRDCLVVEHSRPRSRPSS